MNQRFTEAKYSAPKGFTLIELVTVLAIAAVLVVWAFPSLMQSIQNNQVSSQSLSMVAMLNLTKSEAVRRNTSVTLTVEPTADGGWEAIIEDPASEVEVEGCMPGQLRCSSNTGASVELCDEDDDCGGTFELVFNNRGYLDPGDPVVWEAKTIFLQHDSCAGQKQRTRIHILPTGQIDSCTLPCDSTEVCP